MFQLFIVLATDDVLRTVKFPMVLVPGLKRNVFSSSATTKKDVKTIIEQMGSFLDLEAFGIQLTRLDRMDYLDLTIVKESGRTEPALCAISGEKFSRESVLTTLVPKKPITLLVGSINVDQSVVENPVHEMTPQLKVNYQPNTTSANSIQQLGQVSSAGASKVSESEIT